MSRQRPSILVVFADQMRGRDMRCAGNDDVSTPAMDELAESGILARRCFANTPVCTPNRGSMLTGLYPPAHSALVNDMPIDTNVESIGNIARSHGYKTGYIGKWHLDGVPRNKFTPPGPRRLGFDFWAVHNCNHNYFNAKYYRDEPEIIISVGYEPVVQTDLALKFLDTLDNNDPFCLTLSWGPPHDPYELVPQEYRDRYNPATLQLPANVDSNTVHPAGKRQNMRRSFADYYAAITALDNELGRLLEKLTSLGRREDTIVVFTSDHGDMLWAHGLMAKQLPYEESIHIPFIVSWPGGLPPGVEMSTLCSSVDLTPTLLSLAGLPIPERTQGADLSHQLSDGHSCQDDILIAHHCGVGSSIIQDVPEWRGIRTSRWTYVEAVGRKPWILFDNDADPWQEQNLVDDPSQNELIEKLNQRLTERLTETKDPFLKTEEMISYFGLQDRYQDIRDWQQFSGGIVEMVRSKYEEVANSPA